VRESGVGKAILIKSDSPTPIKIDFWIWNLWWNPPRMHLAKASKSSRMKGQRVTTYSSLISILN
jgi:hypothetical protein